jgi:hypothetical protein
MKKYFLSITGLLLIALLIITSCNNSTKEEEKRKDGLVAGTILKESNSQAVISIPLNKVSDLMHKRNRLTQEWFDYTYTHAWIETIKMKDGTSTYFLGVEASLESKNDSKVYSCYSIYSELTKVNDELILYPDAFQQSCRGKCCNNCKLVLSIDNDFDCECESSKDDPDCKGKSSCGHSESKAISKDQEKNDMI